MDGFTNINADGSRISFSVILQIVLFAQLGNQPSNTHAVGIDATGQQGMQITRTAFITCSWPAQRDQGSPG